MKIFNPFLITLSLGFAILSGTANAQTPGESIFVPIENAAQVQDNPVEPGDSLGRLIALNRDLYRLVMTFNAKAKQVERYQQRYERGQLEKREFELKYPDTPYESEEANIGYSVLVAEPTLCAQLDEALKRYIAKNGDALSYAVADLTKKTNAMSEEEKAAEAEKYRVAMAAIPEVRRAEEILYLCLYKYKNDNGVPTVYSVEKTMRSWFVIETPLIDAWLGNVD
ncbi:MAG: hypothetical protein J6A01_07780 [Proteobacteria bacterium]|nr:hypothetical protein [Pseudomonadota bacterium]